jgi:predicted kinase
VPQVYLLVGLTGSGKRTYCRRVLEPAGVVCLLVDEPEAGVVERLTREVRSGHDVALDAGLWRRADRDAWKQRIEVLDATWRLLYFPASRAALLQRLGVDGSEVDELYTRFEEPVDEGEEVIQPGSY